MTAINNGLLLDEMLGDLPQEAVTNGLQKWFGEDYRAIFETIRREADARWRSKFGSSWKEEAVENQ
jgi:hypothetical protein